MDKPDQREELARLMGEQPTLGSLVEVFDNNGDELAELAIESGVITFEDAFLPHMLLKDGRRVIEAARASNLLPPPVQP